MKLINRIFLYVCLIIFIFSISAQKISHTVKKGETIYGISRKYNISVSELCNENKLSTTTVIKPGQILQIPVKEEKKIILPESTDSYTVKKGDTLYAIANKFGINVDTLKILNKMSGTDTLKVGQVLSVPTAVESDKKLTITDSRVYDDKKKANVNLLWPVTVKSMQYVKGKVSGVSIITNVDEKVHSIHSGLVIFCGAYRGFGNVVFVQSTDDIVYVYTGLSDILVQKGDKISNRKELGSVAIDVRTGKPQLLFMVFKNNNPIDPAKAPRS